MSIFINCCVMATPNPDALNVVDQSTRGDNELDIELDETSEFEKKQAEETTKTTSFIVELAKQSATDAVGVAALYHGNYIVVEDVVTDSLIHRYNAEQKDPALVVRVGDGIRRVNAVEGDPARMKEEANSTQNVVLFVSRISWLVELEKPNASATVGLQLKGSGRSNNLWIVDGIVPGTLLDKYNNEQQDHSLVVKAGDGILRVNAVSDPAEISKEASRSEKVSLLFCRIPEQDKPKRHSVCMF